MKIRVATRGSRLALAQTQIAITAIKKANPGTEFEVITVVTKGDVDKRPLFTMDEKGIFEKEVNESVIRGEADIAVHSLKDVPSDLAKDLVIACIPKRAKPNDVLVNDRGLKLKDIPAGSIVGTSSLRRAIHVMRKRPDLVVKPIRGNVETRVKKVISGEYAAIILAEAGLTRLGMRDVITERFNIRDFVPAPGQGAIAIVCRRDNQKALRILRTIEDPQSTAEVAAERILVDRLEGGCRFPIGAVAITDSSGGTDKITLYVNVSSADGKQAIKMTKVGPAKDAEKLGKTVADQLVKKGVVDLAEGWRNAVEEWNRKL